jgi:hypothetical protein
VSDDEPEPDAEPEPEPETRSRFLGALDAHKYVTDEESRTAQTLLLLPWYFRFFVTACVFAFMGLIVLVIAVGEVTGHIHASVVAKSVVMRWVGGSVAGATVTTYGAMRVRRWIQGTPEVRSPKRRKRARGKSPCPRQVQQQASRGRPNPVGLPPGRGGNRQRHERPYGQKATPRNDDRHQRP